jgi:hypothetical protein
VERLLLEAPLRADAHHEIHHQLARRGAIGGAIIDSVRKCTHSNTAAAWRVRASHTHLKWRAWSEVYGSRVGLQRLLRYSDSA